MTHNMRSKNSRQRGSHTHGGGSMKKRRGAGHRGGRGAAGSGKRGDAKKPSIWKKRAGKHGFTSHSRSNKAPVTIAHLELHKKTLLAEGYLQELNGTWTINLESAGYNKLLATGKAVSKWSITTPSATDGAIEKIKNAGGTITLTQPSEHGNQTDVSDDQNAAIGKESEASEE